MAGEEALSLVVMRLCLEGLDFEDRMLDRLEEGPLLSLVRLGGQRLGPNATFDLGGSSCAAPGSRRPLQRVLWR